jgi:penicillin G amidase
MIPRLLSAFSVFILMLAVGFTVWYQYFLNRFQVDGELVVSALEAPVTVHRDAYGIPYIFADSYADLIRAQGFISAQDRIVLLETYRRVVSGRLAQLLGEGALNSDIRSRVAGYYRAAERHAPLLSDSATEFLRWYVQGVNAYIEGQKDEYPLELSLMGVEEIEPWTVTDALAIFYFGGSIHGTNIHEELLLQALHAELDENSIEALLPVNTNPDRTLPPLRTGYEKPVTASGFGFSGMAPYHGSAPSVFGSNNWAIAPGKSTSGHALLTSDPHLDVRQLPGFMYPVGLFAPGINAVGITMAGMGGILIGRTDHVAYGVTNAYGDSQDTYLETLDPEDSGRYLEGGESLAFATRVETIAIKGAGDYRLEVRATGRGPVISDHAVFGIESGQLISARWATSEEQRAEIGVERFLIARNADELEHAIYDLDTVFFNFVFADSSGNIGQRASGLVPKRLWGGASMAPGEAGDNWNGYIPKDALPGGRNPERQWVGTANHDTRGDAYPYYYSGKFAPHYRYSRMIEVLDGSEKISPQQSWELARDTRNVLAVELAPELSAMLSQHDDTRQLAELLDAWDYRDDAASVGASVYHLTYEKLVGLIFEDEFSPELYRRFHGSRYFWQQRLDDALLAGQSPWFDDRRTAEVESLEDLVHRAGAAALSVLRENLGSSPDDWSWGQLSRIIFVTPTRKSGFGRDLLGGSEHPGRGSHETLNRGAYKTDSLPYSTAYMASARIVMDFADDEKIMAVVPGGNVARQGHPWMTSQLETYMKGDWLPWWRSESKVLEHAQHTLTLLPR